MGRPYQQRANPSIENRNEKERSLHSEDRQENKTRGQRSTCGTCGIGERQDSHGFGLGGQMAPQGRAEQCEEDSLKKGNRKHERRADSQDPEDVNDERRCGFDDQRESGITNHTQEAG